MFQGLVFQTHSQVKNIIMKIINNSLKRPENSLFSLSQTLIMEPRSRGKKDMSN